MTDVLPRVARLPRARRASADAVAGALTPPAPRTLADLGVGARGTVAGFTEDCPASTARRLHDLGFTVGAEVHVLRRAPLGDPVVFHVADHEIALRRAQTRGIRLGP